MFVFVEVSMKLTFLLFLVVLGGCSGRVNWDAKDAHRHCARAIAEWPDREAPPCQALHMCANEAALSPEEGQKLLEMIRSLPDCPLP